MKYILELEDPFAEEPDNVRLDAIQHEDELRSALRGLLEDARYTGIGWQLRDVYLWAGGGKVTRMELKLVEENRDDDWLDKVYKVFDPYDEDDTSVRFTVSIDERMP